jgi:hypothetical protein
MNACMKDLTTAALDVATEMLRWSRALIQREVERPAMIRAGLCFVCIKAQASDVDGLCDDCYCSRPL